MCRRQCVVALATLYLGLVHSWDIAVSVGDQLEFYTDGIKTNTVNLKFRNLTAITYDEVHNMMLFVDKQRDNDAICGYNLSFKNIRCFVKRYGSNIHNLAFDPASDMLFFTDKKDKSINWISLKNQESKNNVYGNLLIKMLDRTPSDIHVDSCNRLIYWTNTKQKRRPYYMERARLNGTEICVVDRVIRVKSFAIDVQTHTNYFFTGLNYDILNKVDLKVKKNIMYYKKKLLFYSKSHYPQELTVSKDYLYWTENTGIGETVWQMLKNASISSAKPKIMCRFFTGHTLGIAANYGIKDQVHGLQDCEELARLIPILETEQTTELVWTTEITETSELGSTTELDWSTENTETSELGSTTELDWSTENTETFELSSTTELDWSTESTETSELGSTTELDWPRESTETSELGSTTELDWSTESTETSELGSTTELDWSTENTETSELSSTTELDWSTENTETSELSSTTELDWSTESTETSELGSTTELDWSTESTETSELGSTTELDWSTESTETSESKVGSKCICNTGYSGKRHEVQACHGYCLNNGNCSLNQKGEPVCHCQGGYVGDKCEVSGCLNYCFQGSCSLNDEGHPKCRCNAGYSGARCETYACHGYCLNSGACSLNKKNEPVCRCVGNHEGTRCEAVKKITFSYKPKTYLANRNLADLVPYWQKPAVNVAVIVNV